MRNNSCQLCGFTVVVGSMGESRLQSYPRVVAHNRGPRDPIDVDGSTNIRDKLSSEWACPAHDISESFANWHTPTALPEEMMCEPMTNCCSYRWWWWVIRRTAVVTAIGSNGFGSSPGDFLVLIIILLLYFSRIIHI